MATKPDDLILSAEDRELIAAVNRSGKPWRKILRELVPDIIPCTESDEEVARRQKDAQRRLFTKLAKLPSASREHLTAREIDKVIYDSEL